MTTIISPYARYDGSELVVYGTVPKELRQKFPLYEQKDLYIEDGEIANVRFFHNKKGIMMWCGYITLINPRMSDLRKYTDKIQYAMKVTFDRIRKS